MIYVSAPHGPRTSLWVTSLGKESQGAGQSSVPVSGTLTTDQAHIVRIRLPTDTVVRRLFWANGATANTNTIQVGIYNDDLSTFLLGTATTSSGASALQFDNVTDTPIAAGRYWLALVCNGTTATVMRTSSATLRLGGSLYQMGSARPLPATLVPAAWSGTGVHVLFGFTSIA